MTTILIVEDNPAHMELAKTVLVKGGYSVLQAVDVDSARHMVRTRLPDLVLMDVEMSGSNGLDLVRELKQDPDPATRAIPFIAMTAYLSEHPNSDSVSAGCVGYIAKPYHYKDLLRVIKEVLEEGS